MKIFSAKTEFPAIGPAQSRTILVSFILVGLLFLNACALIPFEPLDSSDPYWDDPLAYSQSSAGYQSAFTNMRDDRRDDRREARRDRRPASALPTAPGPYEESIHHPYQRIQAAAQHGDLVPGMSMGQVQSAWGAPTTVEIAGDPRYGNARWVYSEDLSSQWSLGRTRVIYFENGRVVGWESSSR